MIKALTEYFRSLGRRGAHDADNGQALVETGLVLPLLLMVLIGVIECGILLNNWIVLTDATRVAARQLAISRVPNTDACQNAGTMLRSAAAFSLNPANIAVSYTVANSCTDLVEGSAVTVMASYPCSLTILGRDFAPSCTLRARTTERVE